MGLTIRRMSVTIIAVGALIVLALFPRFAVADRPLGLHSFDGTYRGSALEIRHDPGSEVEYCEVLATAVADGRGNVKVDALRRCSLTGTFHDVNTGTYSVSPRGLILLGFDTGDGGKGIIANGGDIVILDNDDPSAPDPNVLIFHGVFAKVF
jgi:hypothetical protein